MVGSSKAVLITGGLGYLGGRIASHLASHAPELSIRLTTRRSQDRIPEWAKGLDIVKADMLEPSSLESALAGIDTVIHLAAVDEVVSAQDPDLALRVNGQGTHSLLNACRAQGVGKFVYLSTFHVYGPSAGSPITEETPATPVHPYAITHHLAEDYVNWHRHSYGLDTLILRLSNGYGFPADPWVQRWTLVFNDLCRQAVEKGEIRLRSRGSQHRDFISITDLSRAVLHLLGLPTNQWGNGLFNVGGECSLSILEVAERVALEFQELYGAEVPVIIGEEEEAQSSGPVVYSIDRLKQTGFGLVGNMAQEIRGTFDVCRQLETPAS